MWSYYYWVMGRLEGLGFNEWLWLGLGTLAVGAIFLRGFGSRTGY